MKVWLKVWFIFRDVINIWRCVSWNAASQFQLLHLPFYSRYSFVSSVLTISPSLLAIVSALVNRLLKKIGHEPPQIHMCCVLLFVCLSFYCLSHGIVSLFSIKWVWLFLWYLLLLSYLVFSLAYIIVYIVFVC